jgi:hypothetical protein
VTRTTIAIKGLVLFSLITAGCASWSPPPTSGSQPYFALDPSDAKSIQIMAKKQDAIVARCVEHSSCEHAHFVRGLIGLYESQDSAVKSFEKVIATAPKSHFAASSKLWLQLIQQHPPPTDRGWLTSVVDGPMVSDAQAALGRTTDRLVRDLLDKELAIQQLRASKEADTLAIELLQKDLAERDKKADALIGKKESAKAPGDSGTVQSLQKQLAEREKKIDELYSQLEALKRIDQETREKIRPIRPPSTVPGTDQPTQ